MSDRKQWSPPTDWFGSDYPISPNYIIDNLLLPLGESESFSITMPVKLIKRLEILTGYTTVNRSNLISGLVQFALDSLQTEFNSDVQRLSELMGCTEEAYYAVCGWTKKIDLEDKGEP